MQTNSLKTLLQKNYHVIKRCVKARNDDLAYVISDYSGCNLSIRVHKNIDLDVLFHEFSKSNIKLKRMERNYYNGANNCHIIRLSLARIQSKQLNVALEKLC